jgi:hypothetical protein
MLILPDRSSVAAYLSAPFPTARCRVTAHALSPSPARSAPSLPTPLTYVLVTCAARSLVYPSPIVVGRTANPAMARAVAPQVFSNQAKGTHERCRCWWCSHVVARHGSHSNNRSWPSPSLYCKYMFEVFQMF